MKHAGLHWNNMKCNFLSILNGKRDDNAEIITLDDNSIIKAVENEDTYKFLGIPEAEQHVIKDITSHLNSQVKQRASVVWSSPLSEYNKVLATNVFVLSPALYFMWTEKINIMDLRDLDIIVREAMNSNNAKYKLQTNASLYLCRSKGGRGLKSFETTYKEIKVKAATRLSCEKEDRMVTVKTFDLNRKSKNRSSIIKDGMDYARNDFDSTLTLTHDSFEMKYQCNEEEKVTSDKIEVAKRLKESAMTKIESEMMRSTWQGNIFRIRRDDEHLIKHTCYNWLTNWRECPVSIINDLHSIHLQIVPTLTFTTHRLGNSTSSKICRLCHKGNESAK